MKLATALRYATEIARRVHSVNGVLETPTCSNHGTKFKQIWVFGSSVKGSQNPNDLDILIDHELVLPHRSIEQGARLDNEYLRRYGVRKGVNSGHDAFIWLTKGMKNVSRHSRHLEAIEIDVKVLIYPVDELTPFMLDENMKTSTVDPTGRT